MKQLFILFLAVIAINISICTPGFSHADGENPTRIDDSPGGRMPGSTIIQGDWLSVAPREILKIDQLIEEKNKEIEGVNKEGKDLMEQIKTDRAVLDGLLKGLPTYSKLNDAQRASYKSALDDLSGFMAKGGTFDTKEWERLCDKVKLYNPDLAGVLKGFETLLHMSTSPTLNKYVIDLISGQKNNIDKIQELTAKIPETMKAIEGKSAQLILLRNDVAEYQGAKNYGMAEIQKMVLNNPDTIKNYFLDKGENSPNVIVLQKLISQLDGYPTTPQNKGGDGGAGKEGKVVNPSGLGG